MPRSQVDALARTAEAVRLHKEGHNWDGVADGAGYTNRGTAYRVVTNAYRKQIVEDIESHRASELERINLVEAELLSIASNSNSDNAKIRALGQVLVAIRQRSKLLGLHDHFPATEPTGPFNPLFNPSLGQLKEGNICRMTGENQCGYEPACHSPDLGAFDHQNWQVER